MTIKQLRDIYEGSSTKASDINRKLIFAGIGIVWIFRYSTQPQAGEIFPEVFKPILLLFCISLCMDVMQYIVRSIMWHIYYHIHRVPEANEDKSEAAEPEWMNAFPDSFWYAKFVPTFLAYLGLADLMSITTIDSCAWIIHLMGWRVFFVWGLILGILLIWYVVLEWLPIKNIHKTSVVSQCIRFSVGLAITTACILLTILA